MMKKGWEIKKIGDVADIVHGKNQKDVVSAHGKYPIYGSGGTVMGYATEYLCPAGTTILGRKGTINNPQYINHKFWNVDTAFGIVAKDSIDSKYLFFFIKKQDWSKMNTGTTLPSLTQTIVKNVEIPLPPLSEQKEIVEHLDSSFAKIDTLKANAAKNLDEAKALFQSALKDALEPKKGWEEKILKDICTHIVDCPHSTPPKSDTPTEYPFIRTSDLKQGKISWDVMQYVSKEEYHKRNARITPQKNDIIYGREGTFGDAALLPEYPYFCLGQRVVLLRSNIEIVNPEFLLYTVISPFVYSQAKNKNMGCGVGHVNVADIKRFKMFIPPLSEQQEIVSRLDSLNEKVNTLQQNYSRICSECDAMKQAILRQVFE